MEELQQRIAEVFGIMAVEVVVELGVSEHSSVLGSLQTITT